MDRIPFDTIEEYLNNKDTLRNPAFREMAFQKAQEKLAIDSINMDDFADLYNVPKDKEYVQKLKKIFEEENSPQEKENKKLATVLEAILHIQIEQNCYLGDDVKTISTCEFDDIKNGIDQILEIGDEDEKNIRHLAIAVDITFSVDVYKKIKKIKEKIKSGKLAVIKYFKSDVLHIRGEKGGIPEFVLGIDKNNLENVIQLWLNDENKKLYYHPLHIIILDEILQQTKYYQNYAKRVGRIEISEKYKELYSIFLQVKQEKEELIKEILKNPDNKEKMGEDVVYQSIIQV